MPIAIIVHGGAGALTPERIEPAQAGCKEATLIGWRVLQDGGSALDAVQAAVQALEDNPNFNAGVGSSLTTEGNIEMDAGLMEGHTLRIGAVAAVERIKNPILLARKVLESPHVLLMGRGAEIFAQEQGMQLCTRKDLLTERQYNRWQKSLTEQEAEPRYYRRSIASLPARDAAGGNIYQEIIQQYLQANQTNSEDGEQGPAEQEEKHGTVGAVAIDGFGTLATATSTGGFMRKYPGRVGDSPLVGCGFYADDNAAISCTGHGEEFMRLLLARRAADFVARGYTARDAAEAAVSLLGSRLNGTGGLIIVDRLGNIGFSWNSHFMSHAYISGDMQEPIAGV
jgi:L-asparaginase / beta-aspartyl-peptidase